MEYYPHEAKDEKKINLSTRIFGNRFKIDQSVYEYLIEFLLIFISPKSSDYENGKMKFHENVLDNYAYYGRIQMGLRRFIFYDKSKKNGSIKLDEVAFNTLKNYLISNVDANTQQEKDEIIDDIQDLLYGYAVILKKRAWCAQAMLPVCPEFIFPEAMTNEKERKKHNNLQDVDWHFAFNKRNFLARGGELYYLHLLEYLNKDMRKKKELEELLTNLLTRKSSNLSEICNWIEKMWYEKNGGTEEKLYQKYSLGFIPKNGYEKCEQHSVDELINYLSADLHPIRRVDILAQGIMLQVMRMLAVRVSTYSGRKQRCWIIDMQGSTNDIIKKVAAQSFDEIENEFLIALSKAADESNLGDDDRIKAIKDAKKDTFNLFKSKGKELQCIIPSQGQHTRFTLSEDIVSFLVLAMLKPGEKMPLHSFLQKLYENYSMVIGPNEYRKAMGEDGDLSLSLSNSFNDNVYAFQKFLSSSGFVEELSDATSIVVNPYSKVEVEM